MATPTQDHDTIKAELDGFKRSYHTLQTKLDEALQREKDVAQAHLDSLDAEKKRHDETQAKDAATIKELQERLDLQRQQYELQIQAAAAVLAEKPIVRELRAKHARELAETHAKL